MSYINTSIVGIITDTQHPRELEEGKTCVIDVRHCRGSLKFMRGFVFNLVGNWVGVEVIWSPTFICGPTVYGFSKLSQLIIWQNFHDGVNKQRRPTSRYLQTEYHEHWLQQMECSTSNFRGAMRHVLHCASVVSSTCHPVSKPQFRLV